MLKNVLFVQIKFKIRDISPKYVQIKFAFDTNVNIV